MSKGAVKHVLYKIFYSTPDGDCLVYLGRTNQPIKTRLRGHFTSKPMMRKLDPRLVSRIECVELPTEADMFLYEIYYINLWKPVLNCDDKSREELTVRMPELDFQPLDLDEIGLQKFIDKVNEEDEARRRKAQKSAEAREAFVALRQERREVMARFKRGEISEDEMNRLDDELSTRIDEAALVAMGATGRRP